MHMKLFTRNKGYEMTVSRETTGMRCACTREMDLPFPCHAHALRRPSRPRPFSCAKHARRRSQQTWLERDALAALTPPRPARQHPSTAPNAAGIRTQLSSYQTAPTEYSGQRYRRGRRLTAFRPPVAQDHAHFCHEHAAAQQPGQDPRNTHKVATQASAARLGPAAAACTSLFARKNQELRGRTKSAQIQDKRARAGADGRELRDTPLRLGDPDK